MREVRLQDGVLVPVGAPLRGRDQVPAEGPRVRRGVRGSRGHLRRVGPQQHQDDVRGVSAETEGVPQLLSNIICLFHASVSLSKISKRQKYYYEKF